jgi:hypothetical protein
LRQGRPQPLLVAFKAAEQANELIASAKSLRRSADSFVRDNIFINRNMSKAESKAAYEQRCKRRSVNHQQRRSLLVDVVNSENLDEASENQQS